MKKTITINPLGETRREQWLTIVNTINWQTNGVCKELCAELTRYINEVEDFLEELEKTK